jgi:hypothetical protein
MEIHKLGWEWVGLGFALKIPLSRCIQSYSIQYGLRKAVSCMHPSTSKSSALSRSEQAV